MGSMDCQLISPKLLTNPYEQVINVNFIWIINHMWLYVRICLVFSSHRRVYWKNIGYSKKIPKIIGLINLVQFKPFLDLLFEWDIILCTSALSYPTLKLTETKAVWYICTCFLRWVLLLKCVYNYKHIQCVHVCCLIHSAYLICIHMCKETTL